MANLLGFVPFKNCSLQEERDYVIWRNKDFSLWARFNKFPELRSRGLEKNLFATGFVLDNVRYGRHGEPFSSINSNVSFLKPDKSGSLLSLPDGLQGEIEEVKIFSYSGLKLIITQSKIEEVKYFDFKIILGELFKDQSIFGLLGQLVNNEWFPAESYLC